MSASVNGLVSRLTEHSEIDRVMHAIAERNPMLSPADRTWIDVQRRSEARSLSIASIQVGAADA
ncbi:MAG TPA: hypothetical protein VK211_27005 [Kamptonema sp.]|nr:hypothetical protein [Kamptonema sp.]